jgi:hypothetical protein
VSPSCAIWGQPGDCVGADPTVVQASAGIAFSGTLGGRFLEDPDADTMTEED